MRPPRANARDAGAALLVVLLLVAVMSTVAVAVLDSIRFATRRGANVAARDQAVWYLLGAEQLATQVLRQSWSLDNDRTTLNEPWASEMLVFPIDGGRIEAQITDASNCFNLNGLLAGGQEGDTPAAVGPLGRLVTLLSAAGVDQDLAERLPALAADWIDEDLSPRRGGAEDDDYARATPPYRTPGGPFAEVEEVRALQGLTESDYQAVRPWLCAHPSPSPSRINVNTLAPEQGPLLSMVFDGALSPEAAADVILDRPPMGWSDLEAFFDLDQIARIASADDGRDAQLSVKTQFFELRARVYYLDAYVEGRALLRQAEDGAVAVVRRRFGADG